MKYRKKPVEVEALIFMDDPHRLMHLQEFMGADTLRVSYKDMNNPKLIIPTLGGSIEDSVGDYIVKDVNGEFYPYNPDIFDKIFEQV